MSPHVPVRAMNGHRLLLMSALASAIGGALSLAVGLTGDLGEAAAASTALVIAGFVATLVGIYGVITWFALTEEPAGREYLTLADGYAAAGRFDYARTYYEEALRWGADPEEVRDRLELCEGRVRRAATHRDGI